MKSIDTIEVLEYHSWLRPAAYLSAVAVVLIYIGFGVVPIACCFCSLFLGATIATWIARCSNGRFLYALISAWFSNELKADRLAESATFPSSKSRNFPSKDLLVPSSLNEAVESLLDQIIDEYVNNWYESEISRDRDFLNEIRHQIRFLCSQLVNKALTLDIPALIAEDILPIAALHMQRIIEIEDKLSHKVCHRSVCETHICEKLGDLHFCMGSRRNELDYLRQVADFLTTKLFDDTHLAGRAHGDDCLLEFTGKINVSSWPSQSGRHFLRELIVNAFLFPCLDLIANPDTVNHLLIMAFDSQKVYVDTMPQLQNNTNEEVFLENFIELNSQVLPDSLLQLKLSEVLRDARQYSMFRLYLQDIRGPVRELSFLAEAYRIHDSMQRKEESSSQIACDIWQLFGQFVHDSAPERIDFDSEIVNEFKAAVECNNLPMLDKIIEKTYQIVYQRMQNDYVISFCQSDSFFGYLCGSPPVSVNELIEQRSAPKKPMTSEGTFSLAQFRSRLRRAIAVVSYDGSLDNEESLDDTLTTDVDDLRNDNDIVTAGTNSCPTDDNKGSCPSLSSRSQSHLDIPSIDMLSVAGDDGNVSPASGISGTDEDEASSSSAVDSPRSEPVLIIDNETRNINRWKVNISRIAPMRETSTGRTVYVYAIDVERTEGRENETKRWCIYRRFIEFYVLEMKLLEFHGDSLRFNMLPPKKTPMSGNRAFLEQHRLLFQLFLSSLCKQKVLQKSELLFAFLSSSEEFRYNLLLSDLNPWKVVKKMPGKLSREKGQHLRPFLLTLLANTLYTQDKIDFREKFETSDLSSLSSLSVADENTHSSFSNPLFGNNCNGCKVAEEYDCINANWSRSFMDSVSLLFFSFASHISQWKLNIHSALRLLCRDTIDNLLLLLLRRAYWTVFSVPNLVAITRLIQTAIFCSDDSSPSDQEKCLREELATRRALEFVQDEMPSCVRRALDTKSWRNGVKRLVNTLQYPRLNKHLSYLILDLLIAKLFPDEFS